MERLREHVRHRRQLPVKWMAGGASSRDETWFPGTIENLSGGGLRLRLPRSVPVGSDLKLMIMLDGYRLEGDDLVPTEGQGRVDCLCRVVWSKSIGRDEVACGVRFVGRVLAVDPGEET